MSNIKVQALWLFSSTFFAAILQMLQLGILARRLEANQLGVLAIVNAILTIAMVLQDMGMSSFLVHKQQITRKEQSTIYWVNVLISFLTGILLILLAWPIAIFYKIPQLTGLIALTSLNFLVLGTMSQYQAHFIKAKKFNLLAKIEMFSKCIAFLVTVSLLYTTDLEVSTVILGLLANALVRIICMASFGEANWSPTLEFSQAIFWDALKYGVYSLGSQTINQFRTQADALIVGKVLGAEVLGSYSLAKELIVRPLKLISPVINRLALPSFAERQSDTASLKNIFLRSTLNISFVSSCIYLFVCLFAPVIVRVLYGPGHDGVWGLIPLMIMLGILRPMGGLTGAISQANGRTDVEFYWNIVASVVVICVLLSALIWPYVWYMAMTLSISQILISILAHPFFIKPVIGINFLSYIKQWGPITIFSSAIIFIIYHFNLFITPVFFVSFFHNIS